MWDEVFSAEGYAYGTSPNDFLTEAVSRLKGRGTALCIADGEGRNGVWLAQQGFEVTSVDASGVGLAKAEELARSRDVVLNTVHADLGDYSIEAGRWDLIVSIFCHLPLPLRRRVHRAVVCGLRPGGSFLLEAYTPAQLGRGTGGPPVVELMMDLPALRQELSGLILEHGVELERNIHEGHKHCGPSAVVQVHARKTSDNPGQP